MPAFVSAAGGQRNPSPWQPAGRHAERGPASRALTSGPPVNRAIHPGRAAAGIIGREGWRGRPGRTESDCVPDTLPRPRGGPAPRLRTSAEPRHAEGLTLLGKKGETQTAAEQQAPPSLQQ